MEENIYGATVNNTYARDKIQARTYAAVNAKVLAARRWGGSMHNVAGISQDDFSVMLQTVTTSVCTHVYDAVNAAAINRGGVP